MVVEKMNKQNFMKLFDDMKEDKEYTVKFHKSKFGKVLGVEGDAYGYFLEQLGDDYIKPISKACEFAQYITVEKKDGSKLTFSSIDNAYQSSEYLVIEYDGVRDRMSKQCTTIIKTDDIVSITSSRPKQH